MTNNNIRYSLATDGIPDLEDLWADEYYKQVPKSNVEKQESHNKPPQMEENKMNKIKEKKFYILVAVYVFLIIVELFYYVPYNNIQVFLSKENVPHSEIVGSGYTTMDNITNDNALVKDRLSSETGKTVNTSQLFLNISITTVLAIAVYFLLRKGDEINEMPKIDTIALAFATEDEEKQIIRDYAKKMAEYVKRKEN